MWATLDKLYDVGYFKYDSKLDKEEQREVAYDRLVDMYENLIWETNCDHEIDVEELYNYIISMWEFEKQTTKKV